MPLPDLPGSINSPVLLRQPLRPIPPHSVPEPDHLYHCLTTPRGPMTSMTQAPCGGAVSDHSHKSIQSLPRRGAGVWWSTAAARYCGATGKVESVRASAPGKTIAAIGASLLSLQSSAFSLQPHSAATLSGRLPCASPASLVLRLSDCLTSSHEPMQPRRAC